MPLTFSVKNFETIVKEIEEKTLINTDFIPAAHGEVFLQAFFKNVVGPTQVNSINKIIFSNL